MSSPRFFSKFNNGRRHFHRSAAAPAKRCAVYRVFCFTKRALEKVGVPFFKPVKVGRCDQNRSFAHCLFILVSISKLSSRSNSFSSSRCQNCFCSSDHCWPLHPAKAARNKMKMSAFFIFRFLKWPGVTPATNNRQQLLITPFLLPPAGRNLPGPLLAFLASFSAIRLWNRSDLNRQPSRFWPGRST